MTPHGNRASSAATPARRRSGRLGGGRPETWLLSVSAFTAAMAPGTPGKILDADEQERAGKFLRAEDRERYAAAHVGLRQLLGAYLDVEPAAVPSPARTAPAAAARTAARRPRPPAALQHVARR
ncbi:hypothetical protein NKH77_41520 [Streptomyces sp. M19]